MEKKKYTKEKAINFWKEYKVIRAIAYFNREAKDKRIQVHAMDIETIKSPTQEDFREFRYFFEKEFNKNLRCYDLAGFGFARCNVRTFFQEIGTIHITLNDNENNFFYKKSKK